jgi:ubiquinone/menaquinone biosynthesis C-methylase UbiE
MDAMEATSAVGYGDGTPRSGSEEQRRVTDRFEVQATFWDDLYRRTDVYGLVYQHRRRLALAMTDQLGLPPGSHVLEVGCGAGHTAVALAQRGFQVEAMDPTPKLLRIARQNADRAGMAERIRLLLGDAHRLPLEDGSVALVVALGVVPWLHSPPLAVGELARVLEPGGHVVISADHRNRLSFWLDPLYTPPLAPVRAVAKRVLGAAGLWHPRPDVVPATYHTIREFDRLLAAAGLVRVRGAVYGFGPFSLFGHEVLPERLGVRLHCWLQRLADRGVPLLRSAGAQYLVLARKPR